jgi:hypothetical protein
MNGDPELQAGTIPLTQGILATWTNFDITRLCHPSNGLTSAFAGWELGVYAKHDLARIHGVPK